MIVKKLTWFVKDLSAVPEKYTRRVLDTDKVREAIDNGVRDIPGLEIKPVDSVRFRSK